MGSLIEKVKQEYVRQYGAQKWEMHLKVVHDIWTAIHRTIESLNLPYEKTRLYQDGLPECERETDIVKDVAGKGSPNHRLLLELMERGAKLMGTEDPSLLVAEYRLHLESGSDAPHLDSIQQQEQSNNLLAQRDRHIAARINATLLSGEVGLLFLGLAHSIESLLDDDIIIKNLLPAILNASQKQ
ncbi:MAG: hypothetical protein Q8K59_08290 [Nitrosomonas sp.]|nr:hypothetical protein [Nitrosomonas sp.]MDP1951074.1 hypothetical protein [Nitrosomonas sp.]